MTFSGAAHGGRGAHLDGCLGRRFLGASGMLVFPSARRFSAVFVILGLVVGGCGGCGGSGGTAGGSLPEGRPDDPMVEGPITVGSPFVAGTTGLLLSQVGYEQVEFFISGTAKTYTNVGELGSDGVWEVEDGNTAEYKTRALVYRPTSASDFSGTVIVEWLNVSGGLDAAPDWISMHTEIIREGHVWVGVSAQIDGIEGRGNGIGRLYLKAVSPERYAPLSHPGDSFSYEMFAQVAQALRNPTGIAPLQDLVPERMIAVGESQSAGRLVTYVNALGPVYGLFEGYIIHSRGGGSPPLSQSPEESVTTPDIVNVRDDLNQPILMYQTESDLLVLNSLPSHQPDSGAFRQWEVAGTAHADVYTLDTGHDDKGDDPSVARVIETLEGSPFPGLITCEKPINSGPAHWVLKAGLRGMIDWISTGTPLPEAPRLSVTDDGSAFQLDEYGNVLGGIRTNYVDAPVATLSGLGQTGESFCRIFGTTFLFDAAQLAELYPTEQDYLDAVNASLDAALEAGYLLPPDAALIVADAEESGIGGS
jgi:hypothetical protein